ncbi:MAG: slipin family protein [Myxococcota bacterium]
MARRIDWRETLRRLLELPLFRSHFRWGPINSFVLLAGTGASAALAHQVGELPRDVAIATGIGVVLLLMMLLLGRRWDHVLAGPLIFAIALALLFPAYGAWVLVAGIGLSTVAAAMVQVVSHWEKAPLLRMGHFAGLRGPGLFIMAPFVDRIESVIDQRVRATDFRAERILTRDTVPVYVDAICFWLVWNAEKAVLEVERYAEAVILSAGTALRDAVGKHSLSELLGDRHTLGDEIRRVLDEKTSPWGVTIQSIEITDVVIPEGLEQAMSKRAQAEREGQARVILSNAESEVAEKFVAAARQYRDEPNALHLRAMNMVYEGIRQQGSMILVPSSALDTMGLGALSGVAALARSEGASPTATPSKGEALDPRTGGEG